MSMQNNIISYTLTSIIKLCLSLSISIYLHLSIYLYIYIYLSISIYLSIYICSSIYFYLSISICLSLYTGYIYIYKPSGTKYIRTGVCWEWLYLSCMLMSLHLFYLFSLISTSTFSISSLVPFTESFPICSYICLVCTFWDINLSVLTLFGPPHKVGPNRAEPGADSAQPSSALTSPHLTSPHHICLSLCPFTPCMWIHSWLVTSI